MKIFCYTKMTASDKVENLCDIVAASENKSESEKKKKIKSWANIHGEWDISFQCYHDKNFNFIPYSAK